jgi:hypothetical protein
MHVRLAAMYFMHVFSRCLYRPFFPLYLQGLSIQPIEIATLQSSQLVGEMVFGPMWNAVADKFR